MSLYVGLMRQKASAWVLDLKQISNVVNGTQCHHTRCPSPRKS